MLQLYKQWYVLPWGFILSEKQKRNTLIPLFERFIKYLYYRSQNKIRNTSTDCLLRKNQHLSWYYFQFMLLNPICFWLLRLLVFFSYLCRHAIVCYILNCQISKSSFITKSIFEQNLCVETLILETRVLYVMLNQNNKVFLINSILLHVSKDFGQNRSAFI